MKMERKTASHLVLSRFASSYSCEEVVKKEKYEEIYVGV
jgi:hypothetical protein